MPKYNGHKNWNHWNVSLWIANDESIYILAKRCVRVARARGEGLDGAARMLMEDLEYTWGDKTPDGAPYSFSSVRAALRGM